ALRCVSTNGQIFFFANCRDSLSALRIDTMNPRTLGVAFVVIALLATTKPFTQSQAQPAQSRESIIERIKEHAAREVETNTAMDRDLVLRMFGKNDVELGPAEIVEEYEKAHQKDYEARKSTAEQAAPSFSPLQILLKAGWFVAIVLVGVYLLRRLQQKRRLRQLIAEAEEAPPRPLERPVERPAAA